MTSPGVSYIGERVEWSFGPGVLNGSTVWTCKVRMDDGRVLNADGQTFSVRRARCAIRKAIKTARRGSP